MNTKKLLYALVMLFAITGSSMAQQPFGGCWHPDDVKDWNPANDPEAKFNRSTVALQPRFQDETVMANANQHYDGQVAACLTMHPMCSQCPSQGADNFVGYNPTYWQYMDLLIWWAGSAGEGIIIPPSAPVTDAAHMSGVKSLGQVFFPPSTFGGQYAWVTQMLTKEGDTFPYAQKLYEIAKYYGFDGWFINEETAGGYSSAWGEWISYFYQLAEADGLPMEIQWYDCSTTIGSKLDMMKQDGASFFANYGSPSASNIASQMGALTGAGLSKQQAFESIYFGIECAQGGIGGNGSYIKNCFPTDEHKGSIDLFCPEYPIWKQVVESILGTDDAMGDVAYAKMDQVFKNESRFWVNVAGDPSNVSGRSGSTNPGFANAIAERSTIQTLPFVTTFSAGLGKARYVNGEVRGTHDWYHRGMQTIMPTWRWWIADNTDNLSIDMNWDDAFNMGTSLKVTGKLSANADHLTRLYKTKLAISAGDKLELTYKTNTTNSIEVQLAVSENANAFTTFAATETSNVNGWSVASIDLSSLAGKTVSVIALNFKSAAAVAAYEATLGQLAVYPAGYSPVAPAISNVMAQAPLKEEISDIRLVWDADLTADFDHFNVYFTRKGVKALVGQTRQLAFYIPKFTRDGESEKSLSVSVAAVTKDMVESAETELTLDFPALLAPVVTVKAAKTLVKVNEEVVVEAQATNYPESYEWTAPANAVLVGTEGNKATFKFTAEGMYDLKVKVTNATGATEETSVGLRYLRQKNLF
ncbi:MAG: PKD domain-containing protein [Bacteroidaceae bacterium]